MKSRYYFTRRNFLKVFSLSLASVSLPVNILRSANDTARPNIILCMGDDHAWGETGYNHHPYVKTPVLDDMASKGLRLNRFYAAAPVCSPCRASVMTGRHPNRMGVFAPNYAIRPEEITIARILKDAGYRIDISGSAHIYFSLYGNLPNMLKGKF